MERSCDNHNAWFVDLFVRSDNEVAQNLYRGLGYSVFRKVVGYYNDDSDAYDMRKPLSRDAKRETVRAGGKDILVETGRRLVTLVTYGLQDRPKHIMQQPSQLEDRSEISANSKGISNAYMSEEDPW